MEHEEYTAENYPTFGKKYNGEKAIISLTSWKARINTVSKTLFSLLKQCPGFHIVLVLSEEEFPKMMEELPDNLKLFADSELIEVLWVYKNYKSFKKVLFTMDKYREVPVISADDDCIYTCNYAQELYDKWTENKDCCVGLSSGADPNTIYGYGALYPPKFISFIHYNELLEIVNNGCICDDTLYGKTRLKYKIKSISFHYPYTRCCIFEKELQNNSIRTQKIRHGSDEKIIEKIIKL